MKQFFRSLTTFLFALLLVLVCACSGSDYLNTIPEKSTALISLDLQQMVGEGSGKMNTTLLQSLLHVDDVSECGIDLSSKLYLFETRDGNLGLSAKVASEGKLTETFDGLAKQGICPKLTERKDFHFTVVKDAWLVGFSDKALLVMGPVVADAQADMQRQMVKLLSATADDGIKHTPMFDRLDSISAPIAMVAQAKALPEKFVAPFTLGAPKGTDASQVVIAAEMKVEQGVLQISGETFSFKKDINAALQQALAGYRPINGKYVASMAQTDLAGIFMNVDGKKFLPMLQANGALQSLLMGINTAIDMDNIIRSVDGDMAIVLPTFSEDNLQMRLSAQLAQPSWLADVSYWKQSCPAGTRITDQGKDTFCYSDGKTSFFFGVSPDRQFFSGNSLPAAQQSITSAAQPLSKDIQQLITGKRMAMVLQLPQDKTSDTDALKAVTAFISPLFGNIKAVVYTMEK